jgi:hypothetical protein
MEIDMQTKREQQTAALPKADQPKPTDIRKKNAWWRKPKRTGPRPITITDDDGRVSYLKKMTQAWVWIDVQDPVTASNQDTFGR